MSARRTGRRRGPDRVLVGALSWSAALLGVVLVAVGWHVAVTPEPREPVPLGVGEVYTVPQRVAFVGPLVLYAAPGPERPSLEDLGCVVTEGGGPLSGEAAASEDRIVADGVGLVPLASFPGRTGHSVACAGPAVVEAGRLYVAPGRSGRDLVPLAAFCLAALALPLGAAGLVMLRASRP